MAPHPLFLLRRAVAAAAAGCAAAAGHAQTGAAAAEAPAATLPAVTVTTRAPAPAAGVAGWGDEVAPSRLPLQASVHGAEELAAIGAQRLADLTRVDAAATDAYNAAGYWDSLTVRGFVLDQRYNYRRDGMPISAETSIPLENKEAVEILKGVSGLQAGTSAPGGLVNYVVKRPLGQPLRTALLQWRSAGSVLAAVDLSQRFGQGGAFGLRLNAAHEELRPQLRDADGRRSLLAVAGDWRPLPGGLLEAEIESSRRSQPSQPGFSLLGPNLPAPVDPRINLNNQPWSLPVVFGATTGSLRYTQALGDDWRVQAHWTAQRLRTDDRLAFPFGCSKEGSFDRYCSDGSFDYYAFRSDGERRRSDALRLSADGRAVLGGLAHRLGFGVIETRHEVRLQPRLDDTTVVGTGSVDGRTVVPVLPALGTLPSTDRTERSTELYLRDHVALSPRWDLWAGLRHTRLRRDSVLTDGTSPVAYAQSFSTPWLGVGHRPDAATLLYASWGRGSESEVVPARGYANGGQALPVLRSRQVEVGAKRSGAAFGWSVAAFEIVRPAFADDCTGSDPAAPCTRRLDGSARHRGVEAGAVLHRGGWHVQGGAQWLHARREGSAGAAVDGRRPVNVPAFTLKLLGRRDIAALPGLSLGAGVQHEGGRAVLPDDSVRIPSYTTVSLDALLARRQRAGSVVWRAGIDNLFDRRAWRESPYQYGHAYLYPLAARSARVSVQVGW